MDNRHPFSSPSSSVQASSTAFAPIPNRSEYAGYTALLRDLEKRDLDPIAQRLISPIDGETQSSPNGSPNSSAVRDRSARPRKKRKFLIEDLSTRWPIGLEESLDPPMALDEALMSFAANHIRKHRLCLPNIGESSTQDEDMILPSSLVESTKEYINQILVSMAGMRPVDTLTRRKNFKRISMDGVLGGATMMGSVQG